MEQKNHDWLLINWIRFGNIFVVHCVVVDGVFYRRHEGGYCRNVLELQLISHSNMMLS